MAPHKTRLWPVTAGGFCLISQGAALLGTGLVLAGRPVTVTSFGAAVPPVMGVGAGLLGVAAIINGLRFLRGDPAAWLMAVLLQGLSLGLALLLYGTGHRAHSYPLMAVGITLVAYLHWGSAAGWLPGPPTAEPAAPVPHSDDD